MWKATGRYRLEFNYIQCLVALYVRMNILATSFIYISSIAMSSFVETLLSHRRLQTHQMLICFVRLTLGCSPQLNASLFHSETMAHPGFDACDYA